MMVPGRGRARVLNVLAAVDLARAAHPELALPLNWPRLQRIFARERIRVMRLPIRGKADVIGIPPFFVITLNSSTPSRYHTRHAVHEYAHIRLHFGRPGEHERNLTPCRRDDVREWEAELFARMLMIGPAATMDMPEVARLADRIVAAEMRAQLPAQLPLQLPPSAAPSERPRPDPRLADVDRREDALTFIRRTVRERTLAPLRWSTIGRGCSHDALRFDWSREGKPLRFFDYGLGWLEVSDFRRIETPAGRSQVQQLVVGDKRAEVRVFVISSKDRRRVRFGGKSKRSRSAKDLEQQIRAAEPIADSGAHKIVPTRAADRTRTSTED